MKLDKKAAGVLAIVFGILTIIKPDILAWLVAIYLIIYGVLQFVEK